MRMPSRSSCSARRSPMPFRNLTGVSRRTAPAGRGFARPSRSASPRGTRTRGPGCGHRIVLLRALVPRGEGHAMLRRPGSASRCAAKRLASNGWRSSSPSPTPRNRIGRSSSRRSAATAPPRALPSSLVTTMPGRAHGLREELALLHRVLPHGAVEHEQGLVRRAGQPPAGDADHLAQLVHQAFLGVQAARRVDR